MKALFQRQNALMKCSLGFSTLLFLAAMIFSTSTEVEAGPSSLYLKTLKCHQTEDWTGADECVLVIYVDGGQRLKGFRGLFGIALRKNLNNGQTWSLDRHYTFNSSLRIELWDEDLGRWPDKDDHLGTVIVMAGDPSNSNISQRLTRDHASYTLTYDLTSGTDPRKQRAKEALEQFKNSRTPGRFTKVNKDRLIFEIEARLDNPSLMNQQDQSLCGPMAILVALMMKDPEQYVQMVRDLYERGQYSIPNSEKKIDPDSHLYEAHVPNRMAHVDWMLAASMRDAANAIFDFEEGDEFAGISTPGEMEEWMKLLLRCRQTEFIRTFSWGEKEALSQAKNAVRAGNVAALLIDLDYLPGQGPSTVNAPNHWVLLLDVTSIERNRVEFSVYTWGRKMNVALDEEQFEDLMFGAVIGYIGVPAAPPANPENDLHQQQQTKEKQVQPSPHTISETSALGQNYPNPFNPETWVPYQLAKDSKVALMIYDITGKVVRTIPVGLKSAGIYASRDNAIYWDGRNDNGDQVASGVYIYQLTAGNFTATRKMVILK